MRPPSARAMLLAKRPSVKVSHAGPPLSRCDCHWTRGSRGRPLWNSLLKVPKNQQKS